MSRPRNRVQRYRNVKLEPLRCAPKTSPFARSPDRPSLHRRERSSRVKNRKREIYTSWTVRDEDGNILIYSEKGQGYKCDENAKRPTSGTRSNC